MVVELCDCLTVIVCDCQALKAGGCSVYFNCEDESYSSRDNQETIEKLKENVVDSADLSSYMYSTSNQFIY